MSESIFPIVQVAGAIGAEITLDHSCPLDSQHRVALNDALGEHLVLFFRDQQLDREALKRITKVFAPVDPCSLHHALAGRSGHHRGA